MQWTKGIWVGRLDEGDGHVVLTPRGTVTGRSVPRQAGSLRVQPDLVGKLKGHVQDQTLCQAELMKVSPASVPIRQVKPTAINCLKNKTELHRGSKWMDSWTTEEPGPK